MMKKTRRVGEALEQQDEDKDENENEDANVVTVCIEGGEAQATLLLTL